MKAIEALVDQQIKRWELERKRPKAGPSEIMAAKPGPVITISRQRGSGGSLVALRLAELTGFSHFNRELIDGISHEIGIQKRLVETLDESVRSGFQLWVDGIMRGRIVDSSDYMQSLVKVIGAVIGHGKAIIVGRGANFLADSLAAFNVRIVAEREFRIKSLCSRRNLSEQEAGDEVRSNDENRNKFIKNNFGHDIDDPLGYDLIINSTNYTVDQIAGMILSNYPVKLSRDGNKKRV